MDSEAQKHSANVLANLNGLLSDLEPVYKDIHAHPELSMQEKRTAGIAEDHLKDLSHAVLVFDAAGLALFAVAGAEKALAFHAGPLAATLLGMLTGIGGGMARDVLVREIPTVLRTELYAVAALLGAGVVVLAAMLHLPQAAGAIVGAALCFGLRLVSMRYGWHLPVARPLDGRE